MKIKVYKTNGNLFRYILQFRKNNKGYTLVELLIVLGIILIALATIAIIGTIGYIGWHFLQRVW